MISTVEYWSLCVLNPLRVLQELLKIFIDRSPTSSDRVILFGCPSTFKGRSSTEPPSVHVSEIAGYSL